MGTSQKISRDRALTDERLGQHLTMKGNCTYKHASNHYLRPFQFYLTCHCGMKPLKGDEAANKWSKQT